MPIYEFTCLDRSGNSEILVRSSKRKKDISCSGCGSPKLEVKLSIFSSAVLAGDCAEPTPCSGMPSNYGCCSMDN